jgi:hypothetical protein
MGRELKTILWDKVKWQEGFLLGRGKVICPTCGETVMLGKPWGVCLLREETRIPRKEFPGRLIHTCGVCGIPFLKPKKPIRKITEGGDNGLRLLQVRGEEEGS